MTDNLLDDDQYEEQLRNKGQGLRSGGRIAAAVVICLCLAGLGFAVGNYFPIFGGLRAEFAEPFSDKRLMAGIVHAGVGAFVGLVLVLLAARQSAPKKTSEEDAA